MSPGPRCKGGLWLTGAQTRLRRIQEREVVSSINAGIGYLPSFRRT